MAAVTLIFPPLIESNFGSYYPSTAVLSAFLKEHGIQCRQIDLNESFAELLVGDRMLGKLGSGQVEGVPEDSIIAAMARWASRSTHHFYDAGGRHLFGTDRFGPDDDYAYVMDILARPFFIEADATALRSVAPRQHPMATYRDFYLRSNIVERLPSATALVGISVPMGPQLVPALLLADYLKAAHPNVPIVFGGPTLSLMAVSDIETLLRCHRCVDCVVRFDGEYPLLDLTRQALDGQWHPDTVAGVSYLDGDEVLHNSPGPGPRLDALPPPDYPPDALSQLAEPILGITQARGCYWGKCDYCDFVELFHGSPPFRTRRPTAFVNEIEQLLQLTGVKRFLFITESIPPAFARKTCRLLLDRGLQIKWRSFAMVDRRFDRELLALMVAGGCEFLAVGLESMNTRVLKLVHKSADRGDNIRFLRDARDVGMRLRINLIPDLPSTTYEEALRALADIEELAECFEGVNVFPFEPTRSSNVGRHPEQFGLVPTVPSAFEGLTQYALNHLHSIDPGMADDQREEIHRRYDEFAGAIRRRNAP